MQRGATWHGEKAQAAAGQEVEYVRGSQTASLTGWPSRVEYEVTDDETGLPMRVMFYDWSFTAEHMLFGTEEIASRAGDEVRVTIGGFDYVYEVAPPGKRPVAEWLDSSGILRTVHTKLVTRRASA